VVDATRNCSNLSNDDFRRRSLHDHGMAPLARYVEQNIHVRHRLERYHAGRRMEYQTADPAEIAAEIGSEVDYRPVTTDVDARVAALLADLL
jgi:hypothetical protein